ELLGGEPAPFLHQVALHGADQGHGTSEADGPESQEVAEHVAEPAVRPRLARGCGRAQRTIRAWTCARNGGLRVSVRTSRRAARRASPSAGSIRMRARATSTILLAAPRTGWDSKPATLRVTPSSAVRSARIRHRTCTVSGTGPPFCPLCTGRSRQRTSTST